MKTHKLQRGISIPGMLAIAIMVGFFVMSAIRTIPLYSEYRTVEKIVKEVAQGFDKNKDTVPDIRRKLATLLNTNQVYGINEREIEVYRKDGKTFIDASYEARVPLFWRFDAVMKFDDLKYEAGVPLGN